MCALLNDQTQSQNSHGCEDGRKIPLPFYTSCLNSTKFGQETLSRNATQMSTVNVLHNAGRYTGR